MIRRIKRVKSKKRFTPVKVVEPVKTGDEKEFLFLPPLQPRKKLLVVTSVILGVWVIGLVVMYFTTVYPTRHGKGAARPTTLPTTQTVPAVPTAQSFTA